MEQKNIFNSILTGAVASSEDEDSIPLTRAEMASLPNVTGFEISCKLLEPVKV